MNPNEELPGLIRNDEGFQILTHSLHVGGHPRTVDNDNFIACEVTTSHVLCVFDTTAPVTRYRSILRDRNFGDV